MQLRVIGVSDPLWTEALLTLRHDFYHAPGYVALEADRVGAFLEVIMITRGEAKCFLPYLLRSCGDDLFQEDLGTSDIFDVVSPYGYPGLLLNDAAASDVVFLCGY